MLAKKKRRERGATREAIFAAGAVAFAARGFDGAGVDEIAAAARVNKAMLYYHFKSKRGLYTAVLIDMFSAVADRVAPLARAEGDAAVALEAFVDAIRSRVAATADLSKPTFIRPAMPP